MSESSSERVEVPTRHYMVSLTATGIEEPSGDQLAFAFSDALRRCGLQPEMARAYTSTYAIDPVSVGLKDAWMKIDPDDRVEIGRRWPSIASAIIFLTGMGEEG